MATLLYSDATTPVIFGLIRCFDGIAGSVTYIQLLPAHNMTPSNGENCTPLWSSGQSSWLQNRDVLCFL
jgi:hypothetical protein